MAEYRVQVTVECALQAAFRSADKILPHSRASMSTLRGGDAPFFAAQWPHGKKFVPAGIAA